MDMPDDARFTMETLAIHHVLLFQLLWLVCWHLFTKHQVRNNIKKHLQAIYRAYYGILWHIIYRWYKRWARNFLENHRPHPLEPIAKPTLSTRLSGGLAKASESPSAQQAGEVVTRSTRIFSIMEVWLPADWTPSRNVIRFDKAWWDRWNMVEPNLEVMQPVFTTERNWYDFVGFLWS